MRAGDCLTIALYTLRKIRKGEELTFDYSCVTESEKEFRAAICLCGTTACRGSFLYFAGSKAYMQVAFDSALNLSGPFSQSGCLIWTFFPAIPANGGNHLSVVEYFVRSIFLLIIYFHP